MSPREASVEMRIQSRYSALLPPGGPVPAGPSELVDKPLSAEPSVGARRATRLRAQLVHFRGYLVLVIGTGLARIVSFATAVLLARRFGPDSFGQISIFLAFIGFWSTGDFLDSTFVRYANTTRVRSSADYLRAIFLLKIALNTALLAASFPLSELLARSVFHKPVLAMAIFASFVCGVGLNFLSLWAAVHQASERFLRFTSATSSFYLLSFMSVMIVVFGAHATRPDSVYAAYAIAACTIGVFAFGRLKRAVGRLVVEMQLIKAVLSFSRWLFAANIGYIIFQRLDLFLLAAFASLDDVGVYGAALRMVTIVSLLTGTLAPALLPRAARVGGSPESLRAYLKHGAALSGVLALTVCALWLAAPRVAGLVFGHEYLGAATIVRVFLVGTFFVALYTPLSQLFFVEADPRKMLYLSVLKLTVILASGLYLVPHFGGVGAAVAVALAEVAAFSFVVAALRQRLAEALRIPATPVIQ
jgi:O-antigen/teichoic acid export membrane protein